jgi:hypothetical protein
MYKVPALIAVFFPLLSFVAVGAIELRASRAATADLLRRLTPPLLGIAALAVTLKPALVGVFTPEQSERLSYVLAAVASVIACSGFFITYSGRSSRIWMALGGSTLAFVSLIARIYY